MLTKKAPDIAPSEVTPKKIYLDRRKFLAGVATAGAAWAAGKALWDAPSARASAVASMASPPVADIQPGMKLNGLAKSPFSTTETITPEKDTTHYNNFYEFGTGKEEPATLAQKLKTYPWTVSVDGEVAKPQTFDIDGIMKLAPLEERIYRHRCVEAWSIVVPWVGYSFSELIKRVEPTAKAKFVAFQSFYDPKTMLGPMQAGIQFPYVEGLRLDEAMNPLALLCVGMYGEALARQDGAPVRMVLPWKYGFKSVKSIVKIRFVEKQPPITWNLSAPDEYGFYSNVNPAVDHPRWSQKSERRLGEIFMRKTLPFNGYADQVAHLYDGMDLKKYY